MEQITERLDRLEKQAAAFIRRIDAVAADIERLKFQWSELGKRMHRIEVGK